MGIYTLFCFVILTFVGVTSYQQSRYTDVDHSVGQLFDFEKTSDGIDSWSLECLGHGEVNCLLCSNSSIVWSGGLTNVSSATFFECEKIDSIDSLDCSPDYFTGIYIGDGNETSIKINEVIEILSPNMTYIDFDEQVVSLQLADFVCMNISGLNEFVYFILTRSYGARSNFPICFYDGHLLDELIVYDLNNIHYVLPRVNANYLIMLIKGTYYDMFEYYYQNFLVPLSNRFASFVVKNIRLLNRVIKNEFKTLGFYLQFLRNPKNLKKVGDAVYWLAIVCSIGDFFFSWFPASHLHLLYVMYVCLLNSLAWFDMNWDQLESPLVLLSVFITIVVGGYAVMMMQMHSLIKKSNAAIEYCKKNSAGKLGYVIQFLGLIFRLLLSLAFTKMSKVILTFEFVKQFENWSYICYSITWFLYYFKWYVLGASFVCLFYSLLCLICHQLRVLNKWPYSPGARQIFSNVLNSLFKDIDYLRFVFFTKICFQYLLIIWLTAGVFDLSWSVDYFESILWFVWAAWNFTAIWGVFCITQIILSLFLSFFTTNFFFEKMNSDYNDFVIVVKYLINLYVLYFIDIVKRVLFYIFFIPLTLFVVVHYGLLLTSSLFVIVGMAILDVVVIFWSVNGLCQYTINRRVLPKKCFAVKVFVEGVDGRIVQQFQNSLAQSIPKFWQDTAIFMSQKNFESDKFRAEVQERRQRLEREIDQFLIKLNTDIGIVNIKESNQFRARMLEIANRQISDQLQREFQQFCNRQSALADLVYEAQEDLADIEDWEDVARRLRDIFAEGNFADVLDNDRVNQHFEFMLQRIAAQLPRVRNPNLVVDLFDNIVVRFEEQDWIRLLNNGLEVRRLRAISEDQIWAETEEQACLEVSIKHPEIPEDCRYNGVWVPVGSCRVKGMWEVREVSEKEEIVVKDLFGYFNIPYVINFTLHYIWSYIASYLGLYIDLFLHGKTALTQSMVDLLYEVEFFPQMDIEDLRDLIFNQNIEKFAKFDKKKIDLILNLTYPSEFENPICGDMLNVYKNFCSKHLGHNQRDIAINFNDCAMPLGDLLAKCNINVLPRNFPKSLMLVSHLNSPFVIDRKMAGHFRKMCAGMVPFTNKVVCLSVNYKQNCYIIGHLYSKLCKDYSCGSPFMGNASYGFCVEGERGLVVCVGVTQASLKNMDSIDVRSSVRPLILPIRSAFGVLNGDQIIGNAVCVESNGYKYLVTAAHVVADRGDGLVCGPGRWGSEPVTSLKTEVKFRVEKKFGGKIKEHEGFYYPEFVNLINVCGEQIKCRVSKLMGEIAILETVDTYSMQAVPVMSYEERFDPEFLFVMDEGRPAAVPVVTIRTDDNIVLDYRSKGGYSGGAFFGNDKVCAIHLGGTAGGTGMAYARIFPNGKFISYACEVLMPCTWCNGLHPDSVACVDNHVHCVENQDTTTDDDSEKDYVPFFKLGLQKIWLSDVGGSILATIVDPITFKKQYKRYTYGDFIEKGLLDLVDPHKPQEFIFRGGLSEFVDRVFVDKEDLSVAEAIDKLKSLAGAEIHNQIKPIDSNVYQNLVNRIGENDLIVLLNKSLSELQELNNNFIDCNRELSERKQQLKTLRNEFEMDVDHQNKLKEYRAQLSEFLKEKKNVEELNKDIEQTRLAIKQRRKELLEEHSKKIQEINDKRKSLSDSLAKELFGFKVQAEKILKQIDEIEKKRKEIKAKGVSVEEQKINEKLAIIDHNLNNLKLERKKLQAAKNDFTIDTDAFLKELESKLTKLRLEYQGLKTSKNVSVEEYKKVNENLTSEKKKIMQEFESSIPELPKMRGPFNEKPKPPRNENIVQLDMALSQVVKAMKVNSKVQGVISELIKCEKEAKKTVDLGRLMEIGHEEMHNQILEEHCDEFDDFVMKMCNKYMDIVDMGVYSKKICDIFRTVCVWFVYKHMRDTELALNEYCEDCRPSFAEFAEDLWLRMLERVSLENLNEPQFKQMIVDVIQNQGLQPVYINLTPSFANSRTFRANCLCPNQPAKISCSRCSWESVCRENHEDPKYKDTVGSLGCVLSCLDKVAIDHNAHRQECNQRSDGDFSFTTNPIGVSLSCMHIDGSSTRLNLCPFHFGGEGNCLETSEKRNCIKVVVGNQVRWLDVDCLAGFLYRMVKCDGKCGRELPERELKIARGLIKAQRASKKDVAIGNVYFDLSSLNAKERFKFKNILSELHIQEFNEEVPDVDNQAIFNQVMEIVDQKLDLFLAKLDGQSVCTRSSSPVCSEYQTEICMHVVEPQVSLESTIGNVVKQFDLTTHLQSQNRSVLDFTEEIIKIMAEKLNISVEDLKEKKKIDNQSLDAPISWDEAKEIVTNCILSPAIFKDSNPQLTNEWCNVVDSYGKLDVNKIENHVSLSDVIKDEVIKQIKKIGKQNIPIRRDPKTFSRGRPREKMNVKKLINKKGFL